MIVVAVMFWTLIIFASIAWYAFLLFYIGVKGGRDIRDLTQSLKNRNAKTNDKD